MKWMFNNMDGLKKVKVSGSKQADAKIYKGKLQLTGKSCVKSLPLNFTVPVQKTIITWFQTYDLLTGIDGSPASLRTPNGSHMDAFVYTGDETWKPKIERSMDSSLWKVKVDKSSKIKAGTETRRKKTIMLAMVFDGTSRIWVYRNGKKYGPPMLYSKDTPFPKGSEMYFGCYDKEHVVKWKKLRLKEVQLHTVALDAYQVHQIWRGYHPR